MLQKLSIYPSSLSQFPVFFAAVASSINSVAAPCGRDIKAAANPRVAESQHHQIKAPLQGYHTNALKMRPCRLNERLLYATTVTATSH